MGLLLMIALSLHMTLEPAEQIRPCSLLLCYKTAFDFFFAWGPCCYISVASCGSVSEATLVTHPLLHMNWHIALMQGAAYRLSTICHSSRVESFSWKSPDVSCWWLSWMSFASILSKPSTSNGLHIFIHFLGSLFCFFWMFFWTLTGFCLVLLSLVP